jgi:hypothetical protein
MRRAGRKGVDAGLRRHDVGRVMGLEIALFCFPLRKKIFFKKAVLAVFL